MTSQKLTEDFQRLLAEMEADPNTSPHLMLTLNTVMAIMKLKSNPDGLSPSQIILFTQLGSKVSEFMNESLIPFFVQSAGLDVKTTEKK